MLNKINASIFLLSMVISFLSSCNKDNLNKKFGQYAIGVKYDGDGALNLRFFIEGKESGTLQVMAIDRPSPINDCKDLKNPQELINVFVVQNVAVGKHQLEIKTEAGRLVETLEFNMFDRECIFQEISISADKIKKPASLN
mgnify:CR=1 FL=1